MKTISKDDMKSLLIKELEEDIKSGLKEFDGDVVINYVMFKSLLFSMNPINKNILQDYAWEYFHKSENEIKKLIP